MSSLKLFISVLAILSTNLVFGVKEHSLEAVSGQKRTRRLDLSEFLSVKKRVLSLTKFMSTVKKQETYESKLGYSKDDLEDALQCFIKTNAPTLSQEKIKETVSKFSAKYFTAAENGEEYALQDEVDNDLTDLAKELKLKISEIISPEVEFCQICFYDIYKYQEFRRGMCDSRHIFHEWCIGRLFELGSGTMQSSPLMHSVGLGSIMKSYTCPMCRDEFHVDLEAWAKFGDMALIKAVEMGRIKTVGLLIGNGANLESKDAHGYTPLIMAAICGHARIVELLLGRGANLDAVSSDGATPLIMAAAKGHFEIVKLLIEKGANLEADKNGDTPLIAAASYGHTKVVELLMDQEEGVNLYAANSEGNTALMLAADYGYVDVVNLLLEKMASFGIESEVGGRLLAWACEYQFFEIVEFLFRNGVLSVFMAEKNIPVLIWAVMNGHVELVELLIRLRADLDVKSDENGNTALILAINQGDQKMAKLLIENGAGLDVPGQCRVTPLAMAIYKCLTGVVELLRAHGAKS